MFSKVFDLRRLRINRASIPNLCKFNYAKLNNTKIVRKMAFDNTLKPDGFDAVLTICKNVPDTTTACHYSMNYNVEGLWKVIQDEANDLYLCALDPGR
ncbi:MAG: hypothetical protein EXX96DRAFT_613157 [Benjaminiella poitrasii]|nr:MAG: hypothetical protein EXX96DRAFT_613157 [Benjaminiella poitrasii]